MKNILATKGWEGVLQSFQDLSTEDLARLIDLCMDPHRTQQITEHNIQAYGGLLISGIESYINDIGEVDPRKSEQLFVALYPEDN